MIDERIVLGIISAEKNPAGELAEGLVRERLAACAQISAPVTSFYWWNGSIEKDEEVLIFVKTTKECITGINDFLRRNHPYEVPEFLCFDADDGLPEYMDWVKNETRKRDE